MRVVLTGEGFEVRDAADAAVSVHRTYAEAVVALNAPVWPLGGGWYHVRGKGRVRGRAAAEAAAQG